jgi:hypothetical protein
LKTDRQPETGRKQADGRWYPSRPCYVLSSGLRTSRRWLKPIFDNAEPSLELGQTCDGVLTRQVLAKYLQISRRAAIPDCLATRYEAEYIRGVRVGKDFDWRLQLSRMMEKHDM